MEGTVVSQHGGVGFDADPRRRGSWTRCALPDVRYKLCAGRVLPCKRLKRKDVSVAEIVVD